MDALMHQFAIQNHPNALAVLWDFFSAFPSVSHAYLWDVLGAVGLPIAFIKAIQALYAHNHHAIKLAGTIFPGPVIKAGVKQGCPLSMLLFALCLEPLAHQDHIQDTSRR